MPPLSLIHISGAGGLSSFGKEVHLLDTLLRQTRDCFFFVAMDEFARGTNPQEGAALARALVRYLGTLDWRSRVSSRWTSLPKEDRPPAPGPLSARMRSTRWNRGRRCV